MEEESNILKEIIAKIASGEIPEVTTNGNAFVQKLRKRSKEAEDQALEENDQILKMRRMWSVWVLLFIGIIILFDIWLVSMYGLGIWDFKNPEVVMIVVTENFLKIIGLGLLITHSIFKKLY